VAEVHGSARALLDRVAAVVAPSARVLPPYLALGLDPARFSVVENAVDTEGLAGLAAPSRPAGAPLRVGYLGTLIPSKGLDVLVDAVQRLPPSTARLEVFGNAVPYHGDDGFLTRVFGRLRPGDPVTYHGPYHTGDLPEILGALDVVAAPALWNEAYGLTVREAMAAGRPVVVSRIGGLQDAVADGREGLAVEPGDAAALAAALARLAGDAALLTRMSAAARCRPRGFAAMAAELVGLYHGLRCP
jgi:glycosyltransferase involved in cell wall biosynthesis